MVVLALFAATVRVILENPVLPVLAIADIVLHLPRIVVTALVTTGNPVPLVLMIVVLVPVLLDQV